MLKQSLVGKHPILILQLTENQSDKQFIDTMSQHSMLQQHIFQSKQEYGKSMTRG